MEIIGYKCFNKDMTNRYGKKIEIGKIYTANGNIKVGNDGHGYHFCKNMEDTFRYFDAMNDEVSLCLVKGTGKIDEYEDKYNGYYDIYASEDIEILKRLTREEIIIYGLNLNDIRVCRFIQCFKLTNDEIEMFKEKFSNKTLVLQFIEYYQIGNKDVFKSLWYLHFIVISI